MKVILGQTKQNQIKQARGHSVYEQAHQTTIIPNIMTPMPTRLPTLLEPAPALAGVDVGGLEAVDVVEETNRLVMVVS